jgi:hypothetical protein
MPKPPLLMLLVLLLQQSIRLRHSVYSPPYSRADSPRGNETE